MDGIKQEQIYIVTKVRPSLLMPLKHLDNHMSAISCYYLELARLCLRTGGCRVTNTLLWDEAITRFTLLMFNIFQMSTFFIDNFTMYEYIYSLY